VHVFGVFWLLSPAPSRNLEIDNKQTEVRLLMSIMVIISLIDIQLYRVFTIPFMQGVYCPGDVHWACLDASALGSLIAACPAWKRSEERRDVNHVR